MAKQRSHERSRTPLRVASLLVSWALAAHLASVAALASSYTYSCSTGAGRNGDTFISHVFRTNYPSYDGVSRQAYVRALHTCTPTSTFGDQSFVNLANIQAPGAFVQLGYTVCQGPTGTSGCGGGGGVAVPRDTNPHFWYTCSDASGGRPCLADGMAGLPAPVLNRQYVFKITDGGSVWFYSVKDLTTNDVYEWTEANHSTGYGNEVWWGAEVTYTSSAMGTNQGSPDLFIRRMQYHPVGGPWSTVTQQGQVYEISTGGFVYPSYTRLGQWWHGYVEESYYPADTLQSHTHLH